MASFYQKYRPKKFTQVVGQVHVVKTLTNALKKDRTGHAYLFAGPRGTGKTTLARILAQAVNCQPAKKSDPRPCGRCLNCKTVLTGRSLDIIEIDAASNRGIDEIRELRDKIKLTPATLIYKVYIVDEVHMLTEPAFNALLKTLEEPPAHAKFIFATTEIHKVPPTILSRTQHFDFHRASQIELLQALKPIIRAEKIKISTDALATIVTLAEGSYRDAITLLDQVSSTSSGIEISQTEVERLCGLVGQDRVVKYLEKITAGDLAGALKVIDQVVTQSGNLGYFISTLQEYLRRFLHFRLANTPLNLPVAKEVLEQLEQLAAGWPEAKIIEWLEGLVMVERQTKLARIAQLPLEVLTSRLTKEAIQPIAEKSTAGSGQSEPAVSPPADEAKRWQKAIGLIKQKNPSLAGLLAGADLVKVTGSEIALGIAFDFHSHKILEAQSRKIIAQATDQVWGKPLRIICVRQADPNQTLTDAIEVFG